jgi:SAM-dependent methyltransferase
LAHSEIYADDHHWGDSVIDIAAHDLPGLKASYLLDQLPEHGRVLEIGCGGGRLLNTVARHRPSLALHGCDIRPLRGTPSNFTFTLIDPLEPTLPYEPDSFDAVVMFDVLEHLTDVAGSLGAARDALRPDGRLISFTPLEGQRVSFYRLYRRLFGDDLYVKTKEHIQAFSEQSLRSLVAQQFTVRDHVYLYHLLGQFMDATLFALMKIPSVRKRFWDENPFYAESSTEGSKPPSPLGRALRAANAVAYAESRLLARHPYGAAGLLFTASLHAA